MVETYKIRMRNPIVQENGSPYAIGPLSVLSVCDVAVLWANVSQLCYCYMRTQLVKRGAYPHFSAHDYCGQTTGWSKMPLGMEVCFSSPLRGTIAAAPQMFSVHAYCGQLTLAVAHIGNY